MKLKFFLSIGVLVSPFSFIIAHIYRAEVWEKGDSVCYCLGDVHESKGKENYVNNNHRRDVLYAAQAINASVIIEDKEGLYKEKRVGGESGYKVREPDQGSKDLVHLYDLLIANRGMLRGTSGLYYRAGVDVTNIEFRFLSAADGNLMLKDELDYLDTHAKRILHYDDGNNLQAFYTKIVKNYRDTVYKEGKIFFEHLAQKNKLITPYDVYYAPYDSRMDASYKRLFPRSNPENRDMFKKKKLLFRLYKSFFIDAEIAHAIAQNKDKERIIVCAGGDHILEVAPALETMGYKRTYVLSSPYDDAIDLDAFFVKHEPRYAAGEVKKTYVNYLLDMQCYFDKHPLVALAAGITTTCALLVVGFSPFWCATLARNVAPHNPKARSVIEKSLLAAVITTTAAAVYTLFTPLRAS